jgi:hypothetical protein
MTLLAPNTLMHHYSRIYFTPTCFKSLFMTG